MVFKMKVGVAGEALDPGIRNSNLFPVKAKGEVRFLSEISCGIFGKEEPKSNKSFWVVIDRLLCWIFSKICCRDRKSTRLNSSHANISYAVFCLKKKNIILCVVRTCRPDS